jgi:hypothetical protein
VVKAASPSLGALSPRLNLGISILSNIRFFVFVRLSGNSIVSLSVAAEISKRGIAGDFSVFVSVGFTTLGGGLVTSGISWSCSMEKSVISKLLVFLKCGVEINNDMPKNEKNEMIIAVTSDVEYLIGSLQKLL